jgi:uncharacterized protein DUF7025
MNSFGEYEDRDLENGPGDQDKLENDEEDDYAIAWRLSKADQIGGKGKKDVLIQSRLLRNVLKGVLEDYPISFDTKEVIISPPYEAIYHNRDKLKQHAEEQDDATKTDVQILLEEVEQSQSDSWNDANSLTENGQITFALLWTLFHPGCKVVQKHMGEVQISVIGQSLSASTESEYRLVLWSVDYDGKDFNYLQKQVSIKAFKGSKAITDLEVYPLKFWKGPTGKTYTIVSSSLPLTVNRRER